MELLSAIFDPELGCTAFTVERITCTRGRGGTAPLFDTGQLYSDFDHGISAK